VAAVARLAREIWTEHYTGIIGSAQVEYMLDKFQNEAAIAEQIAQGQEYYLVLRDEEPVGYLAVQAEPEKKTMFLSKIYVRKELRGRGYGKAALEFAEELCRNAGGRRLWLTVNKHNSRSIAWYERMGFGKAGAIVKDIGGGFVMDDYRMEKEIGGMPHSEAPPSRQ